MKKIVNITILCIALLASMGCERGLFEKISYNALPGDYVLDTQDGLQKMLSGCYNGLQSGGWYGGVLYLYEATKGPDFFMRNTGGGYSFRLENRHGGTARWNGNGWNAWNTMYNVIRNTTLIIDNIDDVTGDVGTLRRIKGEAYALRGLAYFDLLRLFANMPKYSCTWGSEFKNAGNFHPELYDPTSTDYQINEDIYYWGVPIIDSAEMGFNILDYEVVRATADESWQYVMEQFEKAYGLLQGVVSELGHVNDAAVLALRMRAALYMERYSDVIIFGKEFMDLYEPNYGLIPYDNWKTQYHKPFNSESIWEIQYTADDNLGSSSINYWARKCTYEAPGTPNDGKVKENIGYAKLGLTFGSSTMGMEHMTVYPNDVRQHLICELGVPGTEYKAIRKYVGNPYHFVHNVPVIRLPEVYLNIAEAAYKLGYQEMADEYLAKITSVRRLASEPVAKVEDILDERRRELILEGHTYFDYARNGRTMTQRQIIECITSNGDIYFPMRRSVYPIPLNEMNANPAIRNQQNPGYAAWYLATEDVEE